MDDTSEVKLLYVATLRQLLKKLGNFLFHHLVTLIA